MIVRGPRPQGNFYVLDKTISEDRSLSWAARGLLIFLLGKPDHWQVSPAALIAETEKSQKPTGRDGVYSLLGELRTAGYLQRMQARNADGTTGQIAYMVSESPLTEKPEAAPLTAKPETARPHPANPTQASIEEKQGLKKKEGAGAKAGISFDVKAGAFVGIDDAMRTRWAAAYPTVPLETELHRAACWLVANPTRAKQNYARFLTNWLSRAAERPAPSLVNSSRPQTTTERREAFARGLVGGANHGGQRDVFDVAAVEVVG